MTASLLLAILMPPRDAEFGRALSSGGREGKILYVVLLVIIAWKSVESRDTHQRLDLQAGGSRLLFTEDSPALCRICNPASSGSTTPRAIWEWTATVSMRKSGLI